MWKSEVSIKSCLSEHTLKTKWTHCKSHKIKVIATVYWEGVKLMIFSTEWIYHARWWPLDTLQTYYIQYSMFDWAQVKEDMLTTIQTSLMLWVYWKTCTVSLPLNTEAITLYFNEVWIVFNTSFTCAQSNMKHWIQYVRQGVQGSSTNMVHSFRAENHQFDTLSVHCSNDLNLVTFEMCSFCL